MISQIRIDQLLLVLSKTDLVFISDRPTTEIVWNEMSSPRNTVKTLAPDLTWSFTSKWRGTVHPYNQHMHHSLHGFSHLKSLFYTCMILGLIPFPSTLDKCLFTNRLGSIKDFGGNLLLWKNKRLGHVFQTFSHLILFFYTEIQSNNFD